MDRTRITWLTESKGLLKPREWLHPNGCTCAPAVAAYAILSFFQHKAAGRPGSIAASQRDLNSISSPFTIYHLSDSGIGPRLYPVPARKPPTIFCLRYSCVPPISDRHRGRIVKLRIRQMRQPCNIAMPLPRLI